jgi:hypothetical protein
MMYGFINSLRTCGKIILILLLVNNSYAQELEPRSLTNVPVGTNFIALGYSHSQGNVLMDPSIPVEGLDARMNLLGAAYVRAINFFGLSGKVDVFVPWGGGDYTGNWEGADTTTARTGFGDPSIRFSVNFIGAPALNKSEYPDYQQKTIAGMMVRVKAPLGQYDPDKLLNLGSNRWTIILKAGVSHYLKKWIFEVYLGTWLFTRNNEFVGNNELKQKPFYTGVIHAIRVLPHNMWIALDAGYGIGGRGIVNGEERDNRMSTIRYGLTYAIAVKLKHTFKLTAYSAQRFEKGPDFNSLVLSYNYKWNRSKK